MATILVWLGSGFAFAFGVFVGALLIRTASKRSPDEISVTEKANNALLERNEIGREQKAVLLRIAEAIEELRK